MSRRVRCLQHFRLLYMYFDRIRESLSKFCIVAAAHLEVLFAGEANVMISRKSEQNKMDTLGIEPSTPRSYHVLSGCDNQLHHVPLSVMARAIHIQRPDTIMRHCFAPQCPAMSRHSLCARRRVRLAPRRHVDPRCSSCRLGNDGDEDRCSQTRTPLLGHPHAFAQPACCAYQPKFRL